MKSNLILKISLCFSLACVVMACSKMDATYDQFLKGGEKLYSKKPDSIQVFTGHNRIKLSWLLISSPNIVQCRVFWNNGKDSVNVPVQKGNDTVSVIINNLEEGFYTFKIFTYDKQGNASVAKDTTGRVYGEEYISSLKSRLVNAAALIGGNPRIIWYDVPDSTAIGVEIKYKDESETIEYVHVPLTDSVTRIAEHPLGDSVQYRTLYLPNTLSIDTFYTPYTTLKMSEAVPVELDKSKFSKFHLPTDASDWRSSHPMSYLWDSDLEGGAWYRTANGSGTPHWYTFDLGIKAKLSSYTLWQRGVISEHRLVYANSNPRVWEIWGSNDPNPDGSFDGWIKLLDCESVKPSGLPLGDVTAEDMEAALDGETFMFDQDAPPVRYIRIKVLDTWDPSGADHSFIQELTFYGIAY